MRIILMLQEIIAVWDSPLLPSNGGWSNLQKEN